MLVALFVDAGLRRRQCNITLRQRQMGKWRDRTEALHAGNRTRTAKACATDSTPSLWWRITDQLRPIRNWGDQPDSHRHERLHGA